MQSIDASLESQSMEGYLKTYDFIIEEHGHIGLIKFFFHHHHEARLYYRYAKLLLRGEAAHWIWNEGRTLDTARPQPYRDVPVEYQPGAFLVIVPPLLISEDFREYRFWLAAWLGLLYGLNLYLALQLLCKGRPTPAEIRRTLWGSLAFLLCFGCIAVTRFDHAVVTAVLLSLVIFRAATRSTGNPALLLYAAFGAVASLGVLTKIVPGVVIPAALLALLLLRKPDWRAASASVAGLTAGLLILNLGFWWLWGDGYWESFAYHMRRGIQLESLYAGLILLAHWWTGYAVTEVFTFSSSNLKFAHSELFRQLPLPLFFAASAWIAWRVYRIGPVWRRAGRADADLVVPVYALSLIFLLLFILTNKVFSPQYLLWVGPLMAALVAVHPQLERTGWLLLAATAMTQAIFPHLYVFLQQFKPPMILLLNARNALLIGVVILLVGKLPSLWEKARGSGLGGQPPLDMNHSLNHREGAQRGDEKNAGQHHERADIGNAGEP